MFNKIKLAIKWIKLPGYLLLLLLVLEAWHRSDVGAVIEWVFEQPLAFVINLGLFVSCFFLFKALTGRTRVALWLLSLSLLAFFTGSRIKLNIKGEPLLPWDFFLGNEAANIGEHFDLMSLQELAVQIVLLIVFSLIPCFFTNRKVDLKKRALVVMFPVIFFLLFFIIKPMSDFSRHTFWHPSINYQVYGVQAGFIYATLEMTTSTPDMFSEVLIDELLQKYSQVEPPTDVKPNLIFIMNEAFWDPTRLPNLEFNEDPIPFFRKLQENHTSGELLVPVFGGSTANTEFEVLTGNSMHLLPQGSLPYSQYIRNRQQSLASVLSEQGYKSVAIHSYLGWFYRRNFVYEQFGFEQFISSENFIDPKYRRGFISDEAVSRRIITEHQHSDQPLFVFAVTMQNHSPFSINQYDEDRIEVSGLNSTKMTNKMNTYATGVKDADDSLQLLIEYFEKEKEPTVLVFFGDHLPLLDKVYTETNYIQDLNPKKWSYEEYQKMYSVPFVVWDNFSNEKESGTYMNSSFLGAFILEKYGLAQTPFIRFLNEVRRNETPIISVHEEVNELSDKNYERYELFQYDQLWKKVNR